MPCRGKILVVDDDLESLDLVISFLAPEGYLVRHAISGELAMESVAVWLPELVLLDVRMPGMGGFEACRRLKASARTRDIPVIFLSAAEALDEQIEGLATGAADFIVKPLRRGELLARVRTHTELGRLRINLEAEVAHRIAVLRENDEMIRLAMQTGRTYTFESNPVTDEIRRSHNCADILGIPGDATKESWSACIQRVHIDDREALINRMAELTPRKDTCECEYRVTGSAGEVVHLRSTIRALFDSDGTVRRFIGMVADITRAKQAESARIEIEQRFRNLADAAPMMICASGPDKRATFFNKAWLSFTGRTLEQEMDTGWTEGVHPDDLENTYASYSTSFDARRKCDIQYRLRRADGEYRWIACCGVPQYSSPGDFSGYVASCMDITDLKRTQEEAFDRQRLESLRVLSGGMAHDFSNLLGSILVEAELAEAELAEGSSPLEDIRRIKGVAARAAEIVRQLMIYSGQDTATLEPVDVSRLVEDMLELLKVSISKHALVKTDLANALPAVLGNAAQIRQVVMNLILNASEAIGGSDGKIQITTSKVREPDYPTPESGDLTEGEYVRLEIADSGCGMAEETKARVFDPFFTTKVNGHGLGLAAVQGIVRLHGGTIRVASVPGRGSSFTVLLPSSRERVRNATASVTTPEGISAVSGTVLLVDDEDALRIAVAKALRRKGFSVLSAADGHAAVDVFQAHADEINAVLLDVTLPSISGLEALRRMRVIKPAVPVVLTSAYARQNLDDTGFEESVPAIFLRKPYRIDDLVWALWKTVSVQAPRGEPWG